MTGADAHCASAMHVHEAAQWLPALLTCLLANLQCVFNKLLCSIECAINLLDTLAPIFHELLHGHACTASRHTASRMSDCHRHGMLISAAMHAALKQANQTAASTAPSLARKLV